MKGRTFLFVIFTMIMSCNMTDNEKIERILNADELYIQQNTYGGIGGYYEELFHLKKGGCGRHMVIDLGIDSQTFICMEEKEELLKEFLKEAAATNDPQKTMSNSCFGIDSEYIIKNGWTTLTLRPSEKSDSIFSLIVYKK